jgi:hypothetical protein
MTKTLSKELLQEAMDHYNEMKHLEFIVPNSLPILFFGDIEKYAKQEFKVITAAINPSFYEFQENNSDFSYKYRFPNFNYSLESLELSYSNYFKRSNNYYSGWFGKRIKGRKGFEAVLNGIGFSFFSDRNFKIALHTDICSPLATKELWGKLTKEEKEILEKKGKPIWTKTVKELEPDLILFSGKEIYLDGLKLSINSFLTDEIQKIDRRFKFKTLQIENFKTTVLIGPNSRFGPYGAPGMDGLLKVKIGNLIKDNFHVNTINYDKYENENVHKLKSKNNNFDNQVSVTLKSFKTLKTNKETGQLTRFKVSESDYEYLKSNINNNLILKISPKKGKHPKGEYIIPNKEAISFIESKRVGFNWKKNKNFNQDSIPKDLKIFFTKSY